MLWPSEASSYLRNAVAYDIVINVGEDAGTITAQEISWQNPCLDVTYFWFRVGGRNGFVQSTEPFGFRPRQ